MRTKESMLGRILACLLEIDESNLGTLVDLLERLIGKYGDCTWWEKLRHFLRGEDDLTTQLVRRLGTDVVRRLASGELSVSEPAPKWREKYGVIYFSVTSDGTTGEGWITRLESKGFRVSDYAKQVLRSPDFKPTSGVTTEVAVLKGMLFENQSRITSKVRAAADKRKLCKPNAELACLIREKFTDEEIEAMDLWYIVAMHEPINNSDGSPRLLSTDCGGDGHRFGTCYGGPDPDDGRWCRDRGFAFAVSQVSA